MVARRTHGPILTKRDLELLVSLFKYRYLSITQLERLHFPSHQTASRRVRLLAGAGYIAPFMVPGFEVHLVALAERGAQAAAEHLRVPFPELGWTPEREKPMGHYFPKHFLLATDFRIALTRACTAHADLALLGFIPEHVDEKTPRSAVQKYIRDVVSDIQKPQEKIAHTPDGVFALGVCPRSDSVMRARLRTAGRRPAEQRLRNGVPAASAGAAGRCERAQGNRVRCLPSSRGRNGTRH